MKPAQRMQERFCSRYIVKSDAARGRGQNRHAQYRAGEYPLDPGPPDVPSRSPRKIDSEQHHPCGPGILQKRRVKRMYFQHPVGPCEWITRARKLGEADENAE